MVVIYNKITWLLHRDGIVTHLIANDTIIVATRNRFSGESRGGASWHIPLPIVSTSFESRTLISTENLHSMKLESKWVDLTHVKIELWITIESRSRVE